MERMYLVVTMLLFGCLSASAQDSTRANILKEVEVVRPTYQREAGKLIMHIAGNKLFKTAANAMDVLKKLPGLEVGGDGSLLLSGRITPGIFINGKPQTMSAGELQQYLNNLSPELIAAIEVINNPSSQYDGEYKGIINIKLKPDITLGWKGMISASLQQNQYRQADNNLLLTYKSKKLAYTARLGYTTGTTIRRYYALQHLANTNIMATNTQMLTNNNNYSAQLGVEYAINKDQQLEVLLRTSHLNCTTNSFNTLHTTDSLAKEVLFNTSSNNNADPVQHNYAANLNYTARWGKTQLQVLTSLATIGNQQTEDIQNKNTLTNQLQEYWLTNMKNDIFIRTAQVDLSGELGKGKWRAGVKLALTTTRNELHYDTLSTANLFVTDSNRTNNFQYDEHITAGYITYERKLNKFNLIAGLRAEHTHSIGNAVTLSQVTKRNYLTWLPSLTVTFDITPNQQLHVSVSRRITRPTFPILNPFRFYFSPLNYWVGNPLLLPSKTSALTLSYSQKAFTVTVNMGREKDPMTRYPEYNPTTNILEYLGRNLPYNDFAGIETSAPVVVTKWWRMSNTLAGYYKKEQTPYHGVTYTIPITWFTVSGSQVFSLPRDFTFEVYYYYSSPNGDGLYFGRPLSYIDLSLQRSWLKGRLNTKVNYNDILNTYRVQRIFREKSIIDNRFTHWFGIRRAILTVSYSFGRSTYKGRQINKNEEENRAGM
ncbi:TonB-dependent receptor domain-containing protein [Niastella yeongjuensis]|nr:TonB-dependent receptor [Niastella yeongjuensis]